MDMIWLMLGLASMAIAYMVATFKKYRSNIENVLGGIGHLSEENVKLQDELSRLVTATEEDKRKMEENKEQIEVNKGRVGELEDRIKNARKSQESLIIATQNWKLDK